MGYFKQWVFNYFIPCVVCTHVSEGHRSISLFVLHLLFETVSVSFWSCCYIFTQLTSTPWCLSVFFFPRLRPQLLLIAMPGYYMGNMERNHIFMLARHVLCWPRYLSSQPWLARYSILVCCFISGEECETFQKAGRQPRMKPPLNLEKSTGGNWTFLLTQVQAGCRLNWRQ